MDADIDPSAPICIGMDYNANINWVICGQPRGRCLNVIKSFYVKFERKTPTLINDFYSYYQSTRTKLSSSTTTLPPSAATMPSTNKTSIGWSSTSLNATAGRWRLSISATRCATTKNISSSTKALRASCDSCHSSIAPTTPTLFFPSIRQVSAEGATASARKSQAKSSQRVKKTSLNTAPTAPTLSTPFISVARNSQSEISSEYQSAVFSNRLTINASKTKFCFAPDDASFPLKRYTVIVLISARKLCFLPFFSYLRKNTWAIAPIIILFCVYLHTT